MDAYDIRLTNFVYQGGDDAIAIKPRSYNIFIQNVHFPSSDRSQIPSQLTCCSLHR